MEGLTWSALGAACNAAPGHRDCAWGGSVPQAKRVGWNSLPTGRGWDVGLERSPGRPSEEEANTADSRAKRWSVRPSCHHLSPWIQPGLEAGLFRCAIQESVLCLCQPDSGLYQLQPHALCTRYHCGFLKGLKGRGKFKRLLSVPIVTASSASQFVRGDSQRDLSLPRSP